MLASRVFGKRVLVALVGVTGVVAVMPQADAPAPMTQTVRYVPLSGEPLRDVVDDLDGDWDDREPASRPLRPGQSCLPFLAPLTAHPRWQVQVAHGHSGCMGDWLLGSFSISSDGKVIWSQPRMPDRTLELSPAQLATVRGLDRLDCVRTEPVGYGEEWFRVGIGGGVEATGGAQISRHSTLGTALSTLLDGLVDAYRAHRLASFAPITVDLELRGYHLALRGTHVTVTRRGRVWLDRDVEDAVVVDLLDAMIDAPSKQHERDGYTAFGTFSAAGIAVPLSVTRFDTGPDEFLARAFEDAFFYHDFPDALAEAQP